MPVLTWGDEWFRRIVPPLVAMQLAVLIVWAILSLTGTAPEPLQQQSAVASAQAGPAAAASAAKAAPRTKQPAAARSIVIGEAKGKVGRVQIGMTLDAAGKALDEKLVIVQQSGRKSRRFEAVAQKAGIKLSGRGRKVDTITVTNVGAGLSFRTSRDIAIGTPTKTIPRRYAYAHKVCGRDWRVERGRKTLWFSGTERVSSITLTSRQAPPFIDCF